MIIYIKLLLREWILWVTIAIDLIFVLFQLIFTKFSPPYFIYIVIAIVGIIWASYKIYLDLLNKVPSKDKILLPKVELSFVEGNEYSYRFDRWDDNAHADDEDLERLKRKEENTPLSDKSTLPNSLISISLRIENTGETPIKILTVDGQIDFRIPFNFMLYGSFNMDNKLINFPIELNCNQISLIRLVAPIQPYAPMTDAQIASRTRTLRENKTKVEAVVNVEYVDPKGQTFNCLEKNTISLLPLCDLYVSHWRKLGKTDLVKLAIGE